MFAYSAAMGGELYLILILWDKYTVPRLVYLLYSTMDNSKCQSISGWRPNHLPLYDGENDIIDIYLHALQWDEYLKRKQRR